MAKVSGLGHLLLPVSLFAGDWPEISLTGLSKTLLTFGSAVTLPLFMFAVRLLDGICILRETFLFNN